MTVTLGVRFRPVDDRNQATEDVRQQARERWEQILRDWPGVERFAFEAPAGDPPVERDETLRQAGDVPPVDLTIEWGSVAHADSLFGNSELVASLYGLVGAAPMTHWVGDPPFRPTAAAGRP